MNRETPTFAATAYASATTNVGALALNAVGNNYANRQSVFSPAAGQDLLRQFQPQPQDQKETTTMATARRLVQVYIADPDENVPLDDCLLYSGDQKLTDLTDQELFFEIDLRDALAKHNEKRAKLINKKVKERTEYLEPARIRDLKMTVVTVASF